MTHGPLPTNDPLLTALKDAIVGGQCVAVIGAGMSRPDYPDWNGLTEELIDKCSLSRSEVAGLEDAEVAVLARDRSPKVYYATIDRLFGSCPPRMVAGGNAEDHSAPLMCAERYHLLARIKFCSYVTLNFDPVLATILSLHYNVNVSTYPSLNFEYIQSKELYYLHGRLGDGQSASTARLVLTSDSFNDAYRSTHRPAWNFFQETFMHKDVCFLGCNPAESNMRTILEVCQSQCKIEHGYANPERPRWFLVWDGDSDRPIDPRTKAPVDLDQMGIHLLHYPKIDPKFSGLDGLLQYLAGAQSPIFRKPGVQRNRYLDPGGPGA